MTSARSRSRSTAPTWNVLESTPETASALVPETVTVPGDDVARRRRARRRPCRVGLIVSIGDGQARAVGELPGSRPSVLDVEAVDAVGDRVAPWCEVAVMSYVRTDVPVVTAPAGHGAGAAEDVLARVRVERRGGSLTAGVQANVAGFT